MTPSDWLGRSQITTITKEDGKKFIDRMFYLYLYNMPRPRKTYTLTTTARKVSSFETCHGKRYPVLQSFFSTSIQERDKERESSEDFILLVGK